MAAFWELLKLLAPLLLQIFADHLKGRKEERDEKRERIRKARKQARKAWGNSLSGAADALSGRVPQSKDAASDADLGK